MAWSTYVWRQPVSSANSAARRRHIREPTNLFLRRREPPPLLGYRLGRGGCGLADKVSGRVTLLDIEHVGTEAPLGLALVNNLPSWLLIYSLQAGTRLVGLVDIGWAVALNPRLVCGDVGELVLLGCGLQTLFADTGQPLQEPDKFCDVNLPGSPVKTETCTTGRAP